MSTRDIASDLAVTVAMNAGIAANGDTFGTAIDIAHYDSGVMFFIAFQDYTDGTYAVTLQDSPDSSVWTDVAADKLILPNGAISLSALIAPGSNVPRIGAFSVNQYLRLKVTSTAVTTGADVMGFAVKKGEQRPTLT